MNRKVNLIIPVIVIAAMCISACTPELVELKEVPIKTNETSIKTNETTNKTSETTVNAKVVPENVKTVKLVTDIVVIHWLKIWRLLSLAHIHRVT